MEILPRLPSLPLKVLAVASRTLFGLILLAWLIFSIAWAALYLFIVPRIGEFRPQLEIRASQALGTPVRIGAIVAHADSLLPSFELSDVRLFDREGRVALQLPRVQATLSPSSLWKLGFEQLAIDHPELNVRRAADGRLYVAGLPLSQSPEASGGAGDWMFSQTEWVIRDGTLLWTDEMLGAPPLALQQVDVVMRNGVRSHAMRLDAILPAELGGRLSLRGRFSQPLLSTHAGLWQRWTGQIFAVSERVDVAQLRRHIPFPLDVAGGSGALRVWVDVGQGRVTGATADVALSQVGLRFSPDLPSLGLARLNGRLGGRLIDGGYEVFTQGLQFDTFDGLHWPGGDVRVTRVGERTPLAERGELQASHVDLDALAQVARRLPLGEQAHETLASYAPKGLIEQLQFRWHGPLEAPRGFDARGRLRGLEVAARSPLPMQADVSQPGQPAAAARRASPGVGGLGVDFELTQNSGRASLVVQQGHVEVPDLFDEPRIAIDQLVGELRWKRRGASYGVELSNVRFGNADAQGELQLTWHASAKPGDNGLAGLPGVLDLQGSMSRADLGRLHRYLPRAVNPKVREYLHQALPQGQAGGVRFRVKGDLRDFPFTKAGQGEFRVTANVQDVRYVYVPAHLQPPKQPPWPAFTGLSGDLLIDHASLQLRHIDAQLEGSPRLRISQGEALIPNLADARIQAGLQLYGPLEDLVRGTISNSPLDAMLGGLLTQARAKGNAEVQLKLQLPIKALAKSSVQGQVRLMGNELQFAPQLPRLTSARGVVHFSERGFALSNVQAQLLGGRLRAEGGTIPQPGAGTSGPQRLHVTGTLTAQGLRQATGLPALAQVARQASGSMDYEAEFGLRNGAPELEFFSSLQGLGLSLPSPLGKSPQAALPLRLKTSVRIPDGSGGSGAGSTTGASRQDQVSLELGDILALRYERDVSGPQPRVLRGTMGLGLPVGEVVPLPDEGVVASIRFQELDLDAWGAILTTPASSGAMPASLRDYLPTSLMVQGASMTVAGQRFNQLVAGGTREGPIWRANLDARELSGYLEYRQSSDAAAGRVYARLARLVLASAGARGVETLLDKQPVSIPALDVVIDSLELRGKNLGRVEMEAVNRGAARRDAGAREWRLSKLNMHMPEATLSASGNWAVVNEATAPADRRSERGTRVERRRTVMNFRLDIADAGGLLGRLDMPGLIRRGKGRMEGQVAWAGSPLALDYPTLGGAFNINVETGQFLKAEPGIAKLMGVLSLQSLPRRLVLDFRDVFSEGFAFDFVRGDVQIEQGIAMTNNLQMKGVNAAVLMEGHADLARETQELRVVVVPEINAGTASLIASWINPAVGLGSFFAQMLLRGPMIASATQEFRISGSWSDPQMTKIETPVPAASDPVQGSP